MQKMGREATVLVKKDGTHISPEDITYSNILNGLVKGKERVFELGYTIEFYPEEGKYHYTGHRTCGVSYSPSQTKAQGTTCPVCKRPLTVGVMHRVDELASSVESNFTYKKDSNGVVWVRGRGDKYPPFVSLVPLLEIIAESVQAGVSTAQVLTQFDHLVRSLGSEHEVLFRAPLDAIREVAGSRIAEGIAKVRSRDISIKPGFDGEYGVVSIWNPDQKEDVEPKQKNQTFEF